MTEQHVTPSELKTTQTRNATAEKPQLIETANEIVHPSSDEQTLASGASSSESSEYDFQGVIQNVEGIHPSYPRTSFRLQDRFIDEPRKLKVVVIGAGIAGITAGILLPVKVPNIDLHILEKNEDVVRIMLIRL